MPSNDSGDDNTVADVNQCHQLINWKAVIACRYLCQGNVIRQVASPYSLCQRFPYALFNAMV